MSNPLKRDPTRSIILRRQFVNDMTRRHKKLVKAVYQLLVEEDALGSKIQTIITTNNRFAFLTDSGKVEAFRSWLRGQIAASILEGGDGTGNWTDEYIGSAYAKGTTRAYIDTKAAAGQLSDMKFYEGGKAQFLDDAFTAPVAKDKLQLIYTRAYNKLQGITDSMATQLSGILADGLAAGQGPRKIARAIHTDIAKINKRRAIVLARTEIVHAHAEGQLNAMERLGVEEVSAQVEWKTAGDDRVCARCAEMEGKVYTIDEARGVIPLHPQCRCAWLPYVPAFADYPDLKLS